MKNDNLFISSSTATVVHVYVRSCKPYEFLGGGVLIKRNARGVYAYRREKKKPFSNDAFLFSVTQLSGDSRAIRVRRGNSFDQARTLR